VPGSHNGKAEIVTGVGRAVARTSRSSTHTLRQARWISWPASLLISPTFKGGVNVSAGFVTNNRDPQNFLYADIVGQPGLAKRPTSRRRLRPRRPRRGVCLKPIIPGLRQRSMALGRRFSCTIPRASFDAFPPALPRGVRNTTADINGDGFDDMLVVPGPGGLPQVKVFLGQNLPETLPPASEPTFIPQQPAQPPSPFPYFAYTAGVLNPPTNTQPNPDVTTGVFLG